MNSKNEKSRNLNCIVIVILLYLTIYCTTSGFVNLNSPTTKNLNTKDAIRIIQTNVDQVPKHMDSETWNILKDVKKNMGLIDNDNLSDQKYLYSNNNKTTKLPEFMGPNLRTHPNKNIFVTTIRPSSKIIESSLRYPISVPEYRNSLSKVGKRRFPKYTRSFEPNRPASNNMQKIATETKLNNVVRTLIPNNTLNLARTFSYLTTIFDNPTKYKPDTASLKVTIRPLNDPIKTIIPDSAHDTAVSSLKKKEMTNQQFLSEECLDPSSEVGICHHLIKRSAWSYNVNLNDCSEFAYSGCGLSRNIFWNKKDCLMHCGAKHNIIDSSTKNHFVENIKYVSNKTSAYKENKEFIDDSNTNDDENHINIDESTKSPIEGLDDDYIYYYDDDYFYNSNEYNSEVENSGQSDAYENEIKTFPNKY